MHIDEKATVNNNINLNSQIVDNVISVKTQVNDNIQNVDIKLNDALFNYLCKILNEYNVDFSIDGITEILAILFNVNMNHKVETTMTTLEKIAVEFMQKMTFDMKIKLIETLILNISRPISIETKLTLYEKLLINLYIPMTVEMQIAMYEKLLLDLRQDDFKIIGTLVLSVLRTINEIQSITLNDMTNMTLDDFYYKQI